MIATKPNKKSLHTLQKSQQTWSSCSNKMIVMKQMENIPYTLLQGLIPYKEDQIKEEELNTIPHFNYYRNLIANYIMTKCMTTVESLEKTFIEVSSRGNSSIDTWWAEFQNEETMTKLRLEQKIGSGTPIARLNDCIIKVYESDPFIFWTGGLNLKLLQIISPIKNDINKLGRKLSRISTTLQTQTITLEKAINGLLMKWDDEILENTLKFKFSVTNLLDEHVEQVQSQSKVQITSVQTSFKHVIRNRWENLHNSITNRLNRIRRSNINLRQPKDSKPNEILLPTLETIDDLNIPIINKSKLSVTYTDSSEALSDIQINIFPSVECPPIETEIIPKDNSTSKITSSSLHSRVSDHKVSPLPWTNPASNANSKTNWLSRSLDELNSSDSDSNFCDTVENFTTRTSEIGIFADQFVLKSIQIEHIEHSSSVTCLESNNPQSLNILLEPEPSIEIEDDRSIVTHFHPESNPLGLGIQFEDNIPIIDHMKRLTEFTEYLHSMIIVVTKKCRHLENCFYQILQKNSWCEKEYNEDIQDVIKFICKACDDLSNPILSFELYHEDKLNLIEKLSSMLRANESCLHIIQDLNHVVNSERRDFKILLQHYSSNSFKNPSSTYTIPADKYS